MEEEPERQGEARLPVVDISRTLAGALQVRNGDLLYVTDSRWWLGGLNSTHALVGATTSGETEHTVALGPQTLPLVVTPRRGGHPVRVKKFY